MRRFWLENQQGQIWNLTPKDIHDKRAAFMADPQGLGIRTRIRSFTINDTYFIEEVATQAQTIQGTLFFSGYDHFQRFIDFVGTINTEEPLKLYYSTGGVTHENKLNKQWYKLVLISELRKTEIDTNTQALRIPIRFDCMSRWRKDQEITLELTRSGDPLVYPFFYPYIYGGSNNLAVEIDNTGNLPTPCRIRVEGSTETPLIRLIQNGEIIDQAQYHITVATNQHLIIDSDPATQEATLFTLTPDGAVMATEDVYYTGERHYAFSNFITIPSGKSLFLVSALNANFGRVTISYSTQKELV